MRLPAAIAALALLCSGLSPVSAEVELSGEVGVDTRVFPSSSELPGPEDDVVSVSVFARPELRWDSDDVDGRFTLVPFGRWDQHDDERTHVDLREAHWLQFGDAWDLLVGVGKVYWGVTESRHLVDWINQVDAVEDVDEEDRLGQPMVQLTWLHDLGSVSAFYLPYFRERTFVGPDGRLGFPVVVDTDRPVYDQSLEEWTPSAALRTQFVLGDFDFGVAHFHGTGREPRFLPDPANPMRVRPAYDTVNQTSFDGQWTWEAWLWKLEAITRGGQGDRFAATVAGFEYTFFDVRGSGLDVGVLLEYLYDGRDEDFTVAPPTVLENDAFAGMRIAWNDVDSTECLAGAITDLDTQTTFFNVEASRRIGSQWTVEIEARILANVATDDLQRTLRSDDYAQLRVSRHF